jgi:hypothetical protein
VFKKLLIASINKKELNMFGEEKPHKKDLIALD